MKRQNDTTNPYRSFGLGKITAPNPPKDNPTSSRIIGKRDLRAGKK